MTELTITSPFYVHSRVDSNTFTMGNPKKKCQSRLYPPVRVFGLGLCTRAGCAHNQEIHSVSFFQFIWDHEASAGAGRRRGGGGWSWPRTNSQENKPDRPPQYSEKQENIREPGRPLTVFFSTLGLVLRPNQKKNMVYGTLCRSWL